jgi:hypothetical protein
MYTECMKFITKSRHGQEMVIIACIIGIALVLYFLKRYQFSVYIPGQNACIADCTQIEGNFRRYNHNIFSADQCICLLDNNINNIWN